LKVLKEILEFKFKIPPNIYQSIFQTMSMLLQKGDYLSKDFILLRVLEVLEILTEA